MAYLYLVQSNMESTKVMDEGEDQRAHGRPVSQRFDNEKFADEAVKSINGFIEKQIERDSEVRFGAPLIHTLYYEDATETLVMANEPAANPSRLEKTRSNVRALLEDVIYRTSEMFNLNEKGRPMDDRWFADFPTRENEWTRRGVTE